MDEIKKVGEIWVTPETLELHFPKSCIVRVENINMKLSEEFPILLKSVDGIKYDVYAKDRKDYDRVLFKLKFKDFYYEE